MKISKFWTTAMVKISEIVLRKCTFRLLVALLSPLRRLNVGYFFPFSSNPNIQPTMRVICNEIRDKVINLEWGKGGNDIDSK